MGFSQRGAQQIVLTTQGEIEADYVVNCAGLYSDRVFEFTGEKPECKIVPFRGEYFKLKPSSCHLVRHLIYPVPDPKLPFLGVHFTRMINGGAEAGPSAVLALRREGYRKTDFSLRDTWESITYPGLARFMMRFPGATLHELLNSCSAKCFIANLQRLVPSIQVSDLEPGDAGVRRASNEPPGRVAHGFFVRGKAGTASRAQCPFTGRDRLARHRRSRRFESRGTAGLIVTDFEAGIRGSLADCQTRELAVAFKRRFVNTFRAF